MSTFTFRVTSSATNTAGTQYGQQPDLGAPSFLDMVVTGSSDPMLPNGTYDAYCLNPLLDILLSPTTHTADGAAGNTVASYVPIGFTSLTQQQIDQVNWLLSQNFTADAKYGGQFNYGEVQTALWKLVGFSDAQIASAGLDRFLNDNNRNVVSSADINFLIQSAQNAIASGNGVVPTNAYFTAVVNPAGDVQPLIVQLQSAKLGNYVWADTDADGIQDSGEVGINNVIVQLYDSNGVLIASTVTGDDFSTAAIEQGYYQFTGLQAGDYQVKFIAPAGQYISQPDTNGNTLDATDSDANTTTGFSHIINLTAGESDQTIDAGLYQKASLGNYVWVDTNNDGQQNDGNTGLNGVTVNLYNSAGDLVGTRVTANDANGNPGYYLFDNLTPGDYSVEFVKPAGYNFTQADQGPDGSDSDANPTTGRTIVTTLVSGENDLTWDAGLVTHVQVIPASLGNYVWVDSNYDGAQNDGAAMGLNGVTVNLYNSAGILVDTRVTANDANGNPGYYLFDNLTPGDYSVEFVKPAGYAFTKQDQGLDGSDSDANTTTGRTITTTLVSGENDLTWDAGLVKLASLGDRVWEDTNANGVQDSGETGIGNVTVRLYDCVTNQLLQTTTTDVNGNYSFTGLMPGIYHVEFIAPNGYVYSTQNVTAEALGTDSDANSAGITACYTVNSGDNITTVDAGLHQKASLGNYVWVDSNNDGQQNDGAAQGLNGVTVNLYNNASVLVGTRVTANDANGNPGYYLFTNLTPGDYSVEFVKPTGYVFAKQDQGVDSSDSDANTTTGRTIITTLVSGENDLTWDAGLVRLVPGIDIEKTTNGSTNTNTVAPTYDNEDAADGAGVPILTAGSDVTWTYKVTNTGNTSFARSEIAIVDDNGTAANSADDMSIANGKITYQSGDNGNNVLDAGESWIYKATGTVQPLSNTLGAATTVNMTGNSYTDGSDGNSRSYSAGDVTVNASAWSRFKGSDSWSKAWLGTYSGGLGVTDSGEGSGSGSSHTVDNYGRDNYVVFQFSQNVVVDKAFLNSVVGDSDMTVYVGTSTTPITSMNNAVLNGMTLNEYNDTSSSSARWADFNAGNVQGNVLILAARDSGQSNDYFKIEQLVFQAVQTGGVYSNKATVSVTGGPSDSDLSHYQTAPALKASIGDKVWEDLDHDNVQDANEPGIANIKVMLQNSSGVTIATMYTDANGNYKFTNLDPGTYRLVFDKTNVEYSPDWMEGYYYDLNDWMWAKKNVGSNDSIDSDVNGDGVSTHNVAYTDYTTLTAGENDMTWDAGITPIVIDLNGDGIQTLSRANSDGTFDLFGNGSAVNSGWLSGEDGFLAVDVNGNGKIDDITELFGGLAKGDGFAKLASYDSNGDGVVDASDAEFASLKIWQDANGNHQTEAGELVSLAEAGVASLTVSYTELPFIDAQGNLHLERSNATLSDGSSVDMTDVYFNVSAEDAAAANVELASLGQLMGDDSGLDGLLAGLGGGVGMSMSSCANAEMFDTAGLDNLSRMAALYEEQAACCA